MCDFHHIPEAHHKDGPVGPIGLKLWDVGGKFLDGGRGGRHSSGV